MKPQLLEHLIEEHRSRLLEQLSSIHNQQLKQLDQSILKLQLVVVKLKQL